MSPSLLQQQVAALNLKPSVAEHLSALLSTYAELKYDRDALDHQMSIESMSIGQILAEAGLEKAKIDEFNLYWSRGKTTKKLDVKKLLAQGVTLAQIEMATTEKPKKDFFSIRGKNDKSRGEDDITE